MNDKNIANNDYILIIENVFKKFPGVEALKNVNFKVKRGSVHGLIGENGAGKSTLINIISGVYQSSAGKIYFEGKELIKNDPYRSGKLGVSVVPQIVEFFPFLTVAENLFIGDLPVKWGFIDRKKIYKETMFWIEKFDLDIKPFDYIDSLTFVQKKIILLLKALYKNAKLIILDETTASLHIDESEKLFSYIKDFSSKGVTFIYISHYIEEIFKVCDYVTILKDGEVVSDGKVKSFTLESIVSNMLGKKITENGYFSNINHNVGDIVYECKNMSDKKNIVKDISFSLRKGEVLSISGIRGCGKEELVNLLFGITDKDRGNIIINGKEVKKPSVIEIFKNGMYLIPEDRHQQALFADYSVANNISMCSFNKIRDKLGFLRTVKEAILAKKFVDLFSIVTPSIKQYVKFLSGGNQQKVVFSKIMSAEPQILLLHSPTVGIDVGSKSEIHKFIEELARSGISIILVTEELSEILNMSDRVLILYRGKPAKTINRNEKEFNRKDITLYMEGGIRD